jgi:flavin-dependent dehydrogenase
VRDVVVVGAGPVGLASAIHAARRGLSVTVIEPRDFPIDKACGEGLMPTAVHRLEALGITVGGRAFRGIAYVDAGHRVEATFACGPGRGVRRTWLDDALHRRAEELGIEFVRERVETLEQHDDHVVVGGLAARYVIGADGLHSTVRRLVGITATSPGPARFGQRQHFAVAPWSDLVEVHWVNGAEAYVTPVGDHCVGVAVLSGRGTDFATHLSAFSELRERLLGAEHGSTLGAGPLRQTVEHRVRGRVALVGDAAGYVDALTGEGINVGLVQADVLADCLAAGDLSSYDHQWRQATRAYRRLTSTLVRARHNRIIGPRIVPAAARFPAVFDRAVQQLA